MLMAPIMRTGNPLAIPRIPHFFTAQLAANNTPKTSIRLTITCSKLPGALVFILLTSRRCGVVVSTDPVLAEDAAAADAGSGVIAGALAMAVVAMTDAGVAVAMTDAANGAGAVIVVVGAVVGTTNDTVGTLGCVVTI